LARGLARPHWHDRARAKWRFQGVEATIAAPFGLCTGGASKFQGFICGAESNPGRAKENFLLRLGSLIPLVRDTMEKAQARYKRAFEKRVQAPCEALRVGDWVFVKSHENQGGKLVFKTLGLYQILKTDGRRLTIESDDGIRTINGNRATRAPEPPEGEPAWARALAAWRVPPLPSSASQPIEAVFDHFVGQGYDDQERLMLKFRWFGYGPREDSWHYVEDLPAE